VSALEELLEVMRRLRDPQTGCAWDREQTFASIVPHTLEEAHEVADAIASGSMPAIRDELGDLLFQVVFLARIAEEQGEFAFDDVARAIVDKLVRRHPARVSAESIFDEQRADRCLGIHESCGATRRAQRGCWRVSRDRCRRSPARRSSANVAARVGFDWPEVDGVRAKVDEELAEFEATLRDGESAARREEEFGDMLFALANWGRRLGIDPEAALRAANGKFESRFAAMERFAAARGIALGSLDLEAWERLWQEAKNSTPKSPPTG
jgi:MazG family protein